MWVGDLGFEMLRYDVLEDYINDYCVDLFVELVCDRVKYAEAYKAEYKKRYVKHPSLVKQYIKSFDEDIKNLAKKCGVKVEELNEENISKYFENGWIRLEEYLGLFDSDFSVFEELFEE